VPVSRRPPDRREIALLVLILVVGALLRWGYLTELRHAPDLEYPPVDAGFTLYWATGLATGDWSLPPDARGRDPKIDGTAYVRPPGHPYTLALLHRLTGGHPLGIRALQMVVGLVSVVLAWWLGRCLLGAGIGLVWAALMASHWALLYYEGSLHDAWLLVLLTLMLMLVVRSFAVRPTAARAAATGACLGLVALVRPNALLFAPVLGVWGWWLLGRLEQRSRLLPLAAAGAAALAIVISPSALRNLAVESRLVLVSANGGITLHAGNNDLATGFSMSRVPRLGLFQSPWDYPDIVSRLERELGRELTFTDASRELGREGRAWIAANPGRAARLVLRRAALFWGPHEIAHNEAVASDRVHSPTLSRLPMPFALSLTGALLGLAVGFAGRNAARAGLSPPLATTATLAAIVLFILTWFVSFMPFLVTTLYRMAVVPFLLLGTAVFLVHLAQTARRRSVVACAWVATAVVLWLLVRVPLVEVGSDLAKWHTQRGLAWAFQGQAVRAEEELRSALAAEPRSATAHTALGALLFNSGRVDEAEGHFRSAVGAEPADPVARFNLGLVLARRGAWAEAEDAFSRVTTSEPTNAEAAANLGVSLERLGDRARAATSYRRALAVDPDHRVAANNLAWLLATAPEGELRDGTEAVRLAERIAAADPQPAVLDTLAAAYAEAGRFGDAVAAAERALAALASSSDPLAARIATRLEGYRRGEAYRER